MWHTTIMSVAAGRRKLGSNQYARRAAPPGPDVDTAWQSDLLSQADRPVPRELVRCGSVWDSDCTSMVGPPRWEHDSHPGGFGVLRAADDPDTPPDVLRYLADRPDLANRPMCCRS